MYNKVQFPSQSGLLREPNNQSVRWLRLPIGVKYKFALYLKSMRSYFMDFMSLSCGG